MSYDRSQDAPEVATNGWRIVRDAPADLWEGLWPSRKGLWPPRPAAPRTQAGATPAPEAADDHEPGAAVDREIAELSRAMEARHTELAQETASALDALRAGMDLALARMNDTIQRHNAEAIESRRAEGVKATDAHATTLEVRLQEFAASEARLRAELAADVAEQAALARTEALERASVREAAVEARLTSEMERIVSTSVPVVGPASEARQAMKQRLDEVTDHVGVLSDRFAKLQELVGDGELAELRSQLTSSEASVREATAAVAALTASVQEDASRITALQRQVRKDADAVRNFTSTHDELDRKISMLDAVIDAVDAAVAGLETGWAERLTGLAQAATNDSLAPVQTDLLALQADVAAIRKALSGAERRAKRSSDAAPSKPTTRRAASPKSSRA